MAPIRNSQVRTGARRDPWDAAFRGTKSNRSFRDLLLGSAGATSSTCSSTSTNSTQGANPRQSTLQLAAPTKWMLAAFTSAQLRFLMHASQTEGLVSRKLCSLLYRSFPDAELTEDDEKHAVLIFMHCRMMRVPNLLSYAHKNDIELDFGKTESLIGDIDRQRFRKYLWKYLNREDISTGKFWTRNKDRKELRCRCPTCIRHSVRDLGTLIAPYELSIEEGK